MTLYMKEQNKTDKKMLPVKPENIPEELKVRPQWVVWKAVGEKPDKVPYSPRSGRKASTTDLLTWATFEEACQALQTGQYSGLGFVFCCGDPYAGVDLDECVDSQTGEIRLWALEIIQYLDSYTELSPSGKGLHVIIRGKVPTPLKRDQIEMYCMERFFTMTGYILGAGHD